VSVEPLLSFQLGCVEDDLDTSFRQGGTQFLEVAHEQGGMRLSGWGEWIFDSEVEFQVIRAACRSGSERPVHHTVHRYRRDRFDSHTSSRRPDVSP
jgi:hypothetical protein